MKSPWEKWIRFRLIIIFLFVLLLLSTAGVRAYQLQILKQTELFRKASCQNTLAVDLQPSRGIIFDRNHHELAVSVEVDSVFAHPWQIREPQKAARDLNRILNVGYRDILKKLTSSAPFVWIKRGATPAERGRLEQRGIKGIEFIPETKRYYPNRDNAGHLLGFVGLDGKGLEGLEQRYDQHLRGGVRQMIAERDAHGRLFLTSGCLPLDTTQGKSLVLTIDLAVQCILEKELRTAVSNAEACGGMGIIMNPKTGEILGLAVQPSFNPNNYRTSSPDIWRNRIVTDCFDPGSTFKVFFASAALEEGLVSPDYPLYCEKGAYRVARRTIHDVHKYETLTFAEVIKYSSNIGVAKIAERMEGQVLYSHIRDFGFGEKTGIDLTGESAGLVRPSQEWRDIDKLNISFGQGISVTALQLLNGLCAIANGGYLMRPYVVKAIVDEHGNNQEVFYPAVVKKVLSPETARTVTEMMIQVVSEDGTGRNAVLPGIEVAGKTGTAQKFDAATGRFSQKKFIGSFMGFAPARHPRIAVLIVIDEPRGRGFGGTVAAPAFKAVVEQVLQYLNVHPGQGCSPALVAQRDSAPANNAQKKGAVVFFDDQAPPDCVPNFTGLSIRRVLQLAQDLNLAIQVKGSGKAVWQNPAPGVSLQGVTSCRVLFKPTI